MKKSVSTVREIGSEFIFISDSQDVAAFKQYTRRGKRFDSFFVQIEDGEYVAAYGMLGIIPYLNKTVTKVL